MNQEDIQKKQKKVMIYAMLLCIVLAVGASYAFFTAGMSSETTTTVRADAGTMKIIYAGGNNINLSGIYPRDEVWATKTITVTGNNKTEADMYYKLTLVVDSNTFSTSDPLQYELTSTNTSTNGNIIPAISKTNITGSSIELGSGNFVKANNAKHTYQLKIYYPNSSSNQNSNQGATFNAHVEIASVKAETNEVISFKFANSLYQAIEGSTLQEWRDSKFNTFGYYFTKNLSRAIVKDDIINIYYTDCTSSKEISKCDGLDSKDINIYNIVYLNENTFKKYIPQECKIPTLGIYHLYSGDFTYIDTLINWSENNIGDDEIITNYNELTSKLNGLEAITEPYIFTVEDPSQAQPNNIGKYEFRMNVVRMDQAYNKYKILSFDPETYEMKIADLVNANAESHTIDLELAENEIFFILVDKS